MPHAPSVRGGHRAASTTFGGRAATHRAATRPRTKSEDAVRGRSPRPAQQAEDMPRASEDAEGVLDDTCPPLMTRVLQACLRRRQARRVGDVIPLVWQRVLPAGRRAEQDICLHWLVSLLSVLTGVSLSLSPAPQPHPHSHRAPHMTRALGFTGFGELRPQIAWPVITG